MSDLTKINEAREWVRSWELAETDTQTLRTSALRNAERFAKVAAEQRRNLQNYRDANREPADYEQSIEFIEQAACEAQKRAQIQAQTDAAQRIIDAKELEIYLADAAKRHPKHR
jgi:hypothetical protein